MIPAHPLPPVRFRAATRWSRGSPTHGEARARVRALLYALDPAVRARVAEVTVNENRRHWLTVRSTSRGRWRLSLHWGLLAHVDALRDALTTFGRTGQFGEGLQAVIDNASAALDIEPVQPELPRLRAHGQHVDLARLLEQARRYLPAHVAPPELSIGWSRASGRARRSLRLGRADVERGRITIHPVLDRAEVPEYVVEMVVYHELCHVVAPPLSADEAARTRQRRIHHRAFRALERRYPRLDEADEWIREHLSELLRSSLRR